MFTEIGIFFDTHLKSNAAYESVTYVKSSTLGNELINFYFYRP